jgi:hypothetical protein
MSNLRPAKRYTMCVGSSDICPNINDRLDGFNSYINKDGDYVRILLGSKVIGESITLKNVREFYCLTPHWNDSTIDQAIGRVVRNGSHVDLEEQKREVDIYIHASVLLDDPSSSVDIKKLEKCKQKEQKIQEVAEEMIEHAVDKLCLIDTTAVKIDRVVNFAAAYIHNHVKGIADAVSSVFATSQEQMLNVHDVSRSLDIDQTVFNEALCRIIYSNTPLYAFMLPLHTAASRPSSYTRPSHTSSFGTFAMKYEMVRSSRQKQGNDCPGAKCGFLRAWDEYVFLVDDPSLPYVMIPEPHALAPNGDEYFGVSASFGTSSHEIMTFHDEYTFVQTFRYLPVRHKALVLEDAISHNKSDVLKCVSTLYADIGSYLYHLLLYRNLESSYTSSNPVPKKPLGKTRKFDPYNGTWSFVDCPVEEQVVFNSYKLFVEDLLSAADEKYIYGLISTIDGDMRLRLRNIENKQKSMKDHRYVRRGKNMKSIRKDALIDVLQSVVPAYDADDGMSIGDIAHRINHALVSAGLYVMI